MKPALRWATTAGYALFILMNILSNALPIGGRTNADVSNRYASLFTPAGWAFSIWGLIFLWQGIVIVNQWRSPASREAHAVHALYDLQAPWMVAAYVLGSVWLLAFQYLEIPLSFAFMIGILVSLVGAYVAVRSPTPLAPPKLRSSVHWLVEGPLSIFLGWITVATVANGFILSIEQGWESASGTDADATLAACVIVTLVALAAVAFFSDWVIAGVVTWALFAIDAKHSEVYDSGFVAMPWTILGLSVVYTLATALSDPKALKADSDPEPMLPK